MALPSLPDPTGSPGIPAPQGQPGLPVPAFDPMFGTYPSEQPVGLGLSGLSVAQSVEQYPSSYLGVLMQQRELQLLQQQGLSLDSHPSTWGPEEAESQTEQAIAKLATVNPDLAQELMAKRQGEQGTDKGFFGNVKDTIGNLLSPALELGGKALEILIRPARIIPEMLLDKGDPWYKNVGDALGGHSDATWGKVLEQSDWVPDFIQNNNVVRGILGFTLDVASDPITYLTFGTAGIGRKLAAETASAAMARHVGTKGFRELSEQGMMKHLGGMNPEQYATALYDDLLRVRRAQTGVTKSLDELASAVDPDVAGFLAGSMTRQSEKRVVQNMLEAADGVHRHITTSGAGGLRDLALSGGHKLTRAEQMQVLEGGRAAAMASKQYMRAKSFAAATGGIRFRFAIPWTDLRYISAPLVPFSSKVSFQPMRRMFTGTSAGHRLLAHVEKGGATWGDFNTWVNKGMKGLRDSNPQLFQQLRGTNMGLGGMMYSVSEQFGMLTAAMTPHAKMWRGGGLMAGMAANTNRLMRDWQNDLLVAGWTAERAGRKVTRDDILKRAGTHLKEDRADLYWKFREAVPGDFESADELTEWWTANRIAPLQERAGKARGMADPMTGEAPMSVAVADDLAVEQEKMARAVEAFESLNPAEREVLMDLRAGENTMRELANREGAAIADLALDLNTPARLRPEDIKRWNAAARDDVRHLTFRVEADVLDGGDARRSGFGFSAEDSVATGGRGYGADLTAGPAGTQGTEVGVNVRKMVHVDHRPVDARPGATPLDDATYLDEVNAEAKKLVEKAVQGDEASRLALAGEGIELGDDVAEAITEKADQLVTAKLQKDGYQGVLVHEADGTVRATVFDPTPDTVKVVDAGAAVPVEGRGYYPRTLTDEADEFLQGATPEDQLRRVIYGEPQLHHDIRRKFLDESLEEAEASVRKMLKETFDEADHDAIDGLSIFERDPVKVHEKYVKRTSTAILHEAAGYNAGRMANLMDIAPNQFGGPAGQTKWRFRASDLDEETLSQLPDPVQKALARSRKATERAARIERMNAEASEATLHRVHAAIEGTLPPQGSPAGSVQRSVRDVRTAARRTGEELRRDLSSGLVEVSQLRAERKAFDAARAKAKNVDEFDQLARTGDLKVNRKSVRHPDDLERLEREAVERVNAARAELKRPKPPTAPAMPRPKQGMVRLFRGEGPGSVPGGHAFADTPSAARRHGEKVTWVDVPEDVARAAKRRAQESGNVGFELPDEYARQAFNQPVPTSLQGRVAREADAVDDLADRVEHLISGLTEQEVKRAARLESALNRAADAQNEVNKVVARYRSEVQAAVQPAVVPLESSRRGFVPLQVKGLEGLAMHPYIAAEFHSVLETVGLSGVHGMYRKFHALWKEWATVRFPGFHIRNHMGAFLNNVMGGVDISDYRFAMNLRKAFAGKGRFAEKAVEPELFAKYNLGRMFRGRKDKMTYGELSNRIAEMGIGSANSRGVADVRTMTEAIEREVKKSGARGFVRRLDESSSLIPFSKKFGRTATELTENWHRTAGFLGGLKQTGGDFQGARAFTMMRHGDYGDLTDFESRFVKDVIPFYKWMRTNLPLQFRHMLESPAFALGTIKARDAAFIAQGMDPDEERARMPQWMQEEFTLPVPVPKFLGGQDDKMEYLMLDIPMSDLFTGAKEFTSSFLPLVRPVFESFIADKNLFTGQPLEGKQVPLAAWARLPGLQNVLEATGAVRRAADGTPMVSDKVQNLMTTIPVFSRFRNWVYAEPGRAQMRASTIFSTMLGMGLRPFGDEELSKAEASFYYDEVVPLLRMYEDLGIQFPTTKDLDPSVFTALGLDVPESLQGEKAEATL